MAEVHFLSLMHNHRRARQAASEIAAIGDDVARENYCLELARKIDRDLRRIGMPREMRKREINAFSNEIDRVIGAGSSRNMHPDGVA